jgi:hypothetical protein
MNINMDKVTVVQPLSVLRTCLRSAQKQGQESQVNELQTGVDQALTVLGQPPVLVQPREAALDHPPPENHSELVQFASLGNREV